MPNGSNTLMTRDNNPLRISGPENSLTLTANVSVWGCQTIPRVLWPGNVSLKKSNFFKCGVNRSGGNDLSTAEQLLESSVSSNPLPLKGI